MPLTANPSEHLPLHTMVMKYSNIAQLQALSGRPGMQHPFFGDLLLPHAVQIEKKGVNGAFWYQEYEPTSIHLTITGRCYARCKGCINAAITTPCSQSRAETAPIADAEPARDARAIVNLLREHPEKDGVVCFYGGEPLLAPEAISEVMDRIAAAAPAQKVRYMLYTNGDLLEKTVARYPDLIERLWLISVSIDGRQQQHDRIRLGTSLAEDPPWPGRGDNLAAADSPDVVHPARGAVPGRLFCGIHGTV